MNTRPVIDDSAGPVSLSASFNHDSTCFSVGLDSGFCVFNSDPCELKVSRDFNAGIGITEMLGKYNYLALVGGSKNPRWPQTKVIIWDDAKQKPALTLELKTAVLRVRLTKSRIVVALQNSIHLYAFSSPPTKTSVFETADNPSGLCCLGNKLLAFPGRSPGKIQLVELDSGNISIIPAHTSALRAIDLSADGEILVTASETGTLIRVFSTGNCARIAELRRGVDPAFIFSLAISPNSSMLAVTSDKSTLHIFDLQPRPTLNKMPPTANHHGLHSLSTASDEPPANRKWGFLSKVPLLPRVFSDIYSFASTHFEMGDDHSSTNNQNTSHPSSKNNIHAYLPSLGSLPARAQKGQIGWLDDTTLLVIGTGRDAPWERFRLGEKATTAVEEGTVRRTIWRDGWKRYLGG